MAIRVRVRIEGADEVIRALDKLPSDAKSAMRDQAKKIARDLAPLIRAAGRSQGRQTARAASTVRATSAGFWPVVEASNTGRARGLLFGSEFGVRGKFGWYAWPRFFRSRNLQFRPHLGGGSYWFRKTAEDNQPLIQAQWQGAADEVIRRWSA